MSEISIISVSQFSKFYSAKFPKTVQTGTDLDKFVLEKFGESCRGLRILVPHRDSTDASLFQAILNSTGKVATFQIWNCMRMNCKDYRNLLRSFQFILFC